VPRQPFHRTDSSGSAPPSRGTDLNTSSIPAATERSSAAVTEAEQQFADAMDRFKRDNRRPFPTWREVLGVVRGLGYRLPHEQGKAA
jgi:hypothetical protein